MKLDTIQPHPELVPATTRREAQFAIARALAAAGADTPDLDARLLLSGMAGIDPKALILQPNETLGTVAAPLMAAIRRRCSGEPVSRILGHRAFYGHDFEISPATLDPRPDSETVVEVALAAISDHVRNRHPLRILDVGTGSGCLLISLLIALPNACGLGSDVSSAALDVARRNAARLGVASRSDWKIAESLVGLEGPFDLLVSNPPYIPSANIAGLQREVKDFDPHQALDGGSDGLTVYRAMIDLIPTVVPAGFIVFEVGYDQADAVAELLQQRGLNLGWPLPVTSRDLDGRARCVAQKTH